MNSSNFITLTLYEWNSDQRENKVSVQSLRNNAVAAGTYMLLLLLHYVKLHFSLTTKVECFLIRRGKRIRAENSIAVCSPVNHSLKKSQSENFLCIISISPYSLYSFESQEAFRACSLEPVSGSNSSPLVLESSEMVTYSVLYFDPMYRNGTKHNNSYWKLQSSKFTSFQSFDWTVDLKNITILVTEKVASISGALSASEWDWNNTSRESYSRWRRQIYWCVMHHHRSKSCWLSAELFYLPNFKS